MKYLLIAFGSMLIVSCGNSSRNTPQTEFEDSLKTPDVNRPGQENESPNTPAGGDTAFSAIDREFIMKAAMGNTAEVEAGGLALQKATAAGVKDFAAQMVRDHGDAQTKLKAIAGAMMSVPDSLDRAHKEMKTKLSGLSAATFDKEYMAAQVKDHREAIALFENQMSGGSNSALKEFASTTLPHLKMHLEKALSLTSNNQSKTNQ